MNPATVSEKDKDVLSKCSTAPDVDVPDQDLRGTPSASEQAGDRSQACDAGAAGMSSELVSKAFMDDDYLAHFGNYLHKIGKHIVLDVSEAKDWVAKKVSSSPAEEVDSAAASTAADESNTGTAVMAPRKKKILILMSDTGASSVAELVRAESLAGRELTGTAVQVEVIVPQQTP